MILHSLLAVLGLLFIAPGVVTELSHGVSTHCQALPLWSQQNTFNLPSLLPGSGVNTTQHLANDDGTLLLAFRDSLVSYKLPIAQH